jgi:uncharacterized protein YkwD
VFAVTRLVIAVVLNRALRGAASTAHAHQATRALGRISGFANGLINATIVSMLFIALPQSDAITQAATGSVLAHHSAARVNWLQAKAGPIFDPGLDRSLTRLMVPPNSSAFVELPFTLANAKRRLDLEATMLSMVNAERRAHGLRPLQADPEAAAVALAHCKDMFERGYVSHYSPEGKSPWERMRDAGLRFFTAGENISFARTLPMAHESLMESPEHRANILRPTFGRVGIGVLDGGRYGLMVTQNFRN